MKHINHLFSLFLAITLSVSAWGNTVTVDGATGTTSTYLPVALHTNTTNANFAFHSVSQQLYYASELAGASSTRITAISFNYVGTTLLGRKIAVWMNSAEYDSFPLPNEENPSDEANKTPNMVDPGTKVFSGNVDMVDGSSYTITFNTPYVWNGTSNIIVTVLDSTAKKNSKTYYPDATIYTVAVRIFETSGKVRFLHKTSKDQSDYANKGWDMNNLPAAKANSSSVENRKYANRITFTFAAAAVPPATPSDLAVSSVGANIATLSWSAVTDATSYDLEQSADGESWSTLASNVSGTSFEWTGLSAASTQYARISAKNANGSSAPSSAVTVTTDALHEHNGISFNKWVSTTSMPKSGNYYLTNDVAYDFYEGGYLDLNGDLNLCLNGHTINLGIKSINVTADHTMTIYDPVGGGKITGFVAGNNGALTFQGVISVENGGTLVLREGEVENTFPADDPEYKSIAVASGGTLIISGEPVISGNDIDIFLAPSIPAKVITIQSGKPLTNSTPYKVYKMDGVITSGWSNMGGANPNNFFNSVNSTHPAICLKDGEANLAEAHSFPDNVDNMSSFPAIDLGQLCNVVIGRSFSSASFNTICLPFDLSDAQLQDVFGAGYDLQEFVGSDMDGETLMLNFSPRTALVAGKPYVILPESNVSNPTFEGVIINETEPEDPLADDNILFHGVLVPTSLTGGNKNLLFLGAGNELFWPESTDNLKSFRAYFEVLGGVALSPGRVRMAFNSEKAAQGLESIQDSAVRIQKVIRDGKLIIIRDGKEYNAQGNLIR